MASTYPAQAIQQDQTLGKIEEGFQANMVIFNEDLEVQGIIEQGYLEWFLEI
jgi:N-acetylglucosamine-6-phosphate deacetylase